MTCTAYVLQQTLVVPALPAFQRDLDITSAWATWIFTGFLVTSAVCTTPLGKLGDTYGKRRVLAISLSVFLLGTLVAALATSIAILIVGRVLQGTAGAVLPLSFGIVRDEFPRERVGAALGLLSATFGIGSASGLVLSGVIVQHLSLPWLFWLGAIPSAMALVLVVALIPESPVRMPSRFDVWGVVTLSIGLTAVMLGLTEGARWGWAVPPTLALLVSGVATLLVWFLVEGRVGDPMMSTEMMRRPAVLCTNILAVVTGFSLYSSYLLIPTLVQLGHGLPADLAAKVDFGLGGSVVVAGLYLLPASIAMLLTGPAGGALEPLIGARVLAVTGLVSIGLAGLLLAVLHSAAGIIISVALLGAGISLTYTMLAKLVVDAVEQTMTGVVMGMNTVLRTIGASIGAQFSATLLASLTIAGTGLPAERAFTVTFLVAGVVALIGAAAVIPLVRASSPRSKSEGAIATREDTRTL